MSPTLLLPAAASLQLMDPRLSTVVVLLLALVLFATEWVRHDITAMIVVLSLYFLGVLDAGEATAGLGNPVVIVIAAMFVIGHAILKTGAASRIEKGVMALGGRGEGGIIAVSFLGVALVSAFVQNIAAIVLMVPAVIGVARARGLSASRLLMPLAAASLTGGMCTLIGSPAALALDAKLRGLASDRADLAPLGMFETTAVGVAMTLLAVLYYSLLGPRILPARRREESLSETYAVNRFLAEVLLRPGSDLAGRKLVEADLPRRYGVVALGIVRGGKVLEAPDPWTVIHPEDVLLVQGDSAAILRLRRDHAGELLPRVEIGDRVLSSAEFVMAEVMLSPGSRLVNRSLRELDIPGDFGLGVLAVARHGEHIVTELGDLRLRVGDVVLVQGHVEGVERFRRSPDWVVLQEAAGGGVRRRHAVASVAVLAAVVGLALLEVPLAFAAVAGVISLVILGIIRRREIYEAIEWPVVILIAGILPLGTAMQKTGLASSIAGFLADTFGSLGPRGAIAVLYLIGTLLTGFLNNAALTLMLAPIAVELSAELGVSPRPLLFAVVLGASADFLTPVGQSNALVMGPGQYRFRDYVRAGAPLTLLCFLAAMVLIPWLWPLQPGP
ncbi:MAG: SLC13 family permease [Planctomycetaceae bacterium]|nr:SLC13 family permease [Planctomycetota bacterium]NUN52854.1 SLC13 family permease [Planctomycetaceae bacterium]